MKQFQKDNDLGSDGNLGANTVRAMNGAKPAAVAKLGDPVDTIIVNLDRWRWMPRDLGNPYVVVNIPDFRLTLWKDDKVFWTTKIVVGLPGKPTPLLSAEMKFITVNPTWNVPPSIIENEYLPALQEDPQALDRIGLKMTQDADGTVHIYQPPGAGNALGRIRFNFPNKFLVYQHDTPDKHLFARDKRAYSHGCMRVRNPLLYGEKLLSLVLPNEHYTQARLEKMFGGSEININFPDSKFIPVHLTYQTAFVDDDGKLQLREDVYGRDARMFAQLKGSERKVADIAIERPANASGKPVRGSPRHVWRRTVTRQRRRPFLRMAFWSVTQRPAAAAGAMAAGSRRANNLNIDFVRSAGTSGFRPIFFRMTAAGGACSWYRRVDLNHRPLVPQTSALTN